MKKVMFALCFIFGGIVAVNAQQNQDTTSNQYRTDTESQDTQGQNQDMQGQNLDQDRERISVTELPESVKRSLEGQEYRGWLINGAFKASKSDDQSGMQSDTTNMDRQGNTNINGSQGEEVFIVELKNGAQTKTVRFDSEGEKIEGMGDEDQSQQNNQYNQNDQMNQQNQTDPNQQQDQADPNQQYNPNAPEQEPGQTEPSNRYNPNAPGQQPGQTDPDNQYRQRPDQSERTSPENESGQRTPGQTPDQTDQNNQSDESTIPGQTSPDNQQDQSTSPR